MNAYTNLHDYIDQLTIVGDGPLKKIIETKSREWDNIVVTGAMDNYSVQLLLTAHDYLILPSKYDGWGAVVNEALSVGTRVLCSDTCGASSLIDNKFRGKVFTSSSLSKVLTESLKLGKTSDKYRYELVEWSRHHISGRVAADYFTSFFTNNPIDVPWKI